MTLSILCPSRSCVVDVNDPADLSGTLDRAGGRLAEVDTPDADRGAVTALVESRRGAKRESRDTLLTDLGHPRRASARAETPLVEVHRPDAEVLLATL